MVKRRSYKPRNANKNYKRKMYRKRPRTSRTTMRATRSAQGPIAARLITKLKYCESFQLQSTTASAPVFIEFRLNSIFDPNESGVGRQPYGHDQLQALYRRYRVFACRWRLRCQSQSSIVGRTTVVPYVNVWPGGTADQVAEMPRAITKANIQGGAGSESTQFVGRISLPKLEGVTSVEFKDDTYSAPFGENPGSRAVLRVMNHSPISAAQTVDYLLTLVYYVECFDPIMLGPS